MHNGEKFLHTKRLLKNQAAALCLQEVRFLDVGPRCREDDAAGEFRTVLTNPVVKIAAREITCYFQIRHDQVQRLAIEHLERLAAISDCMDGSKAFTQDFAFQVQ